MTMSKWPQMIIEFLAIPPSEMSVLLFSMILYLFGIVVLLYLRPAMMFHRDGRWKEFGVGHEDTTLFPLWMFCIVWAVVSYGICRLFEGKEEVLATVAATNIIRDNSVMPLSVSGPADPAKPGFYKLNTGASRKKGAPRYIYVGTEPPADLDDS